MTVTVSSRPAGGNGSVLVSFALECPNTRFGEHLRVVGSLEELGTWSPKTSSVELTTSPADFPLWRSDWVALPPGSFEYKYVICKEGGKYPRWEDARGNREVHFGGEGLGQGRYNSTVARVTVFEIFNGPRLQLLREEMMKELPQLPLDMQQLLPELEEASRRSNGNRSLSFCTLPLPNRLGVDKGDACPPGLRRWATFGCLAELPAGMLPTKRALGLPNSGDGGLVREAVMTELAEQVPPAKEKDEGGMQRIFSKLSVASTSCTAVGGGGGGRRRAAVATSGTPGNEAVSQDTLFEAQESDNDKETFKSAGSEETASQTERSEDETFFDSSPQQQDFNDSYCLKQKLGEGAFGVVYSCCRRDAKSNELLAVKVVQRSRLTQFALEQLLGNEASGKEGEVSLHHSLPAHRNIVGLHECFEEPWGVRLVMDICHGGDLFDEIIRVKEQSGSGRGNPALPDEAARNVLRQVLSAVDFCHEHGVVHRDLKVENILLERSSSEVPLERPEAVVKLCDFGLAARCWSSEESAMTDPVGSPDYIAPEVARLEPYGRRVDVWSAGAVLFVCLRGSMPFPAKTDQEALEMVRIGGYTFDDGWENISSAARKCVTHLMDINLATRPTARQGLLHPWLA